MNIVLTMFNGTILFAVACVAFIVPYSTPVMAQSSTDQGLTASITCNCSKTYEVGNPVPITINVYKNGVPAPNTPFLLEAGSSIHGFGSYGAYDRAMTLQTDNQGEFVYRIVTDSDTPDQSVDVRVSVPPDPPYGSDEPVSSNVVTVNLAHHGPYFNWGGLISTLGFGLIFPIAIVIGILVPIFFVVVIILGLLIFFGVFGKKRKGKDSPPSQ